MVCNCSKKIRAEYETWSVWEIIEGDVVITSLCRYCNGITKEHNIPFNGNVNEVLCKNCGGKVKVRNGQDYCYKDDTCNGKCWIDRERRET